MNPIRHYLASRKLLKAQAVDLQRQLAEAWDERDVLEEELGDLEELISQNARVT